MEIPENKDLPIRRKISKLTALISQQKDNSDFFQVNVYYSKDNWISCQCINLILSENSTINQLKHLALKKLKEDNIIDNFESKNFNIMLFKKKKQKPNDEYPICNLDSEVIGYRKNNFCLVEDTENKKSNILQEEITKKNNNNEIKRRTGIDEVKNNYNNLRNINQAETEGEYYSNKACSSCLIL
jgi:hypothetical protein